MAGRHPPGDGGQHAHAHYGGPASSPDTASSAIRAQIVDSAPALRLAPCRSSPSAQRPVPASYSGDAQAVATHQPGRRRGHRVGVPRLPRQLVGGRAGHRRQPGLDRLLAVDRLAPVAREPALVAHRLEAAVGDGVLQQEVQRGQAGVPPVRLVQDAPGQQQRAGDGGVAVGEGVVEPQPVAAGVQGQPVQLALGLQPQHPTGLQRAGEALEVGRQARHGVRHGARRVQVRRRGDRPGQQLSRQRAPVRRRRAGRGHAEAPDGLPQGVLAGGPLHEAPVVAHQVGEATGRLLRGLQEAQAAGHQPRGDRVPPPRALDRHHQRAGHVVGAVAVVARRDAERRVLEDAHVVGEGAQVPEVRHGQRTLQGHQRACLVPRDHLLEQLRVGRADRGPAHRPAVLPRPLLQARQALLVTEQRTQGLRHRLGVAERHQLPPPVGKQLAGVGVGGRDDGATRADGVGERPAHDLVAAVVRREVDVAGGQVPPQLLQVDVPVHEADVVLQPQLGHPRDQRLPVGVPVAAQHVRVGRAEHHVEHVGVLGDDVGQRVQDHLDALAGRQQAEGEQDPAADGEDPLLGPAAVQRRPGGHAVREDADLVAVDAAALDEQVDRLLGQHHEHVGQVGQATGRRTELRRRVRDHRVQRGHDRHPHLLQQVVDVAAVLPAEDPELVLDAEHVDGGPVHELGRRAVVVALVGADLEDDLRAVGVLPALVGQGDLHGRDLGAAAGEGLPQVVGEGRDAAVPRGRGPDEAHRGRAVLVHGAPVHRCCVAGRYVSRRRPPAGGRRAAPARPASAAPGR